MLCRPERADRPRFKKVLLPLDGSELNAGAFLQTQQLAASTGAGVVLLRLVDTAEQIWALRTPAGYELGAYIVTDEALRHILAREHEDVRRELEADATRLRAAGLADVTVVATPGTPGASIVATAEQLGCDVIVMSSRGRGGREGAVLLVRSLKVASAVSAKS